jgi:hypothetical protein
MARGLIHDTLRVILSVGGVLLVLLLAGKLFGVFLHNQQTETAHKTLMSLLGKSERLEDEQTASFPLVGPCGKIAGGPLESIRKITGETCIDAWYLMGWGSDVPLARKPERCLSASCLCICKGDTPEACQDLQRGVCVFLPQSTTLRGLGTSPEELERFDTYQRAVHSQQASAAATTGSGAIPRVALPPAVTQGIRFPPAFIELRITKQGTALMFAQGA